VGEPVSATGADNRTGGSARANAPFHHEAALYADRDGFLGATLPFVRAGVEAREPVLVVVGAEKIALLRDELGDRSDRVLFADMRELGSNPARIIPEWREFVDHHAVLETGVRGIGEPVWPGRGADELAECHRHEALLNLAFEGVPSFRLRCPYDAKALAGDVVAEARRTHPFVWEDGKVVESAEYEMDLPGRALDGELPEPEGEVSTLRFERGRLDRVRGFVWERARGLGLQARPAGDLVLAASELASNSARFGGGSGEVRVWGEGVAAFCEVSDAGRMSDPLAGRAHPKFDQLEGRGLWLVNQICDLVQVRSSESGTVVRVSMPID
jgi:anti-sigma regulatory factor (Ser/Thr protein kinase)